MRQLREVADFVRGLRRQLRFGEISRAAGGMDFSAPRQIWEEQEALQALADASAVRNLVFDAVPKIEFAVLRGFYQPAREPPETIVLGTVSREIRAVHKVSSLVMRAMLYGFYFCFEDGFLRPRQQVTNRIEEFIA